MSTGTRRYPPNLKRPKTGQVDWRKLAPKPRKEKRCVICFALFIDTEDIQCCSANCDEQLRSATDSKY